jgi:hypothetical protein
MRFASDETLMARETTEPTSDFAFDAKKRKSFDLNQDADTLSQVGSQLSRQILIGGQEGADGCCLQSWAAAIRHLHGPVVAGSICALRRLVRRDVTATASGEACLPMAEQAPTAALGRNRAAVLGSQFAGSITGLELDRKAEFMRTGLLAIPGRMMDASRPSVIRG